MAEYFCKTLCWLSNSIAQHTNCSPFYFFSAMPISCANSCCLPYPSAIPVFLCILSLSLTIYCYFLLYLFSYTMNIVVVKGLWIFFVAIAAIFIIFSAVLFITSCLVPSTWLQKNVLCFCIFFLTSMVARVSNRWEACNFWMLCETRSVVPS